ncbi:MAG: hypothetical protein LBP24_01610 [Coriobacteriales bacterium]|jgi:hypothetical protein|nr:hypothetical protein [Coriobacteriales bacterium]
MLLRSKSLLVLIALAIVCVVGGVVLVSQNISENTTFEQGGYILAGKAENEDGGYTSVRVAFEGGTAYQVNHQNNQLTFATIGATTGDGTPAPAPAPASASVTGARSSAVAQGIQDQTKAVVEDYGFVHYEDGSAGALKPGVMLDLSLLAPNDMSAYNINPGTLLTSSGSGYSIEHMSENVPLESVLWKLSADKMMVLGSSLSLQLSEGDPYVFKDFVEVSYIDDGVMQVSDAESTVLTISPVALLTVNNGPVIDLYNRIAVNDEAQLPLSNLLVGSSDNVDITKVEEDVREAVSIPTFTVIQGRDGQSGVPGTSGERGEAGDSGAAGAEGATGSSGIGVEPEEPEDPDNPNGGAQKPVEQFVKPIFQLQEFVYNSVVLRGSVVILDDEDCLVPESVTLRLVNVATGITVYELANANGGLVGESSPWLFEYEPLTPNTAYKLTISAQYRVANSSGSDEIYTADFITKTIIADNVGLQLMKSTITSESIDVNLRKEEFSGATSAKVYLYNASGEEVSSQLVTLNAGDNIVTFPGLTADTTYFVSVEQVSVTYNDGSTSSTEQIAHYGEQMEISTLKELTSVTVAAPRVYGNIPNMSISAQPGNISGVDPNAIVNYRYEFRQEPSDPTAPPALTLSSQTAGPVLANVSPTATTSPSLLKWQTDYRVCLVIEVYDNEKIIEYQSPLSTPVGLYGNQYPIVTYLPNDSAEGWPSQYDWALGLIRIDPNGGRITVDSDHPIAVVFDSSESTHQLTKPFTTLAPEFNYNPVTGQLAPFTLPVDVNSLQAKTAYKVTVWGYVDTDNTQATDPVRIPMGTFSLSTASAGFAGLHLQNVTSQSTHTFAVDLWLTDGDNGSFAYEASNLAEIELELYFGVLDLNYPRPPDATATLSSIVGTPLQSTLGGTHLSNDEQTLVNPNEEQLGYVYYAKGVTESTPAVDLSTTAAPNPASPGMTPTGKVRITEATFNLSAQQLANTATLTLMVKAAKDYTSGVLSSKNIFVNTFTLTNAQQGMRAPVPSSGDSPGNPNNGIDLYTSETAPVPPSNRVGVNGNVIYESDRSYWLSGATDASGGTPLASTMRPDYDPQTAVGLRAESNFPSPNQAESFTYTLYRTKTDQNDYYIQEAPPSPKLDELIDENREEVLKVKLPTYKNGNSYYVPKLNVGFGTGTNFLPSGNTGGTSDNDNQPSYTVYLANAASYGQGFGQTKISGWDSEDDGRGYHYYFTYEASLNLGNNTYTYPKDFTDGTETDYSTMQLRSIRLSTPCQEPQFKVYPSISTASTETWKYRLNLLDDGVLVDENGASANIVTLTDGAPAQYSVSETTGDIYNSLKLEGLTADSTFSVKYFTKPYRLTNFASLDVPDKAGHEKTLLNNFHRNVYTTQVMELTFGSVTLYPNADRNAIFATYKSMPASAMASVAGIRVTVVDGTVPNPHTWHGLLPIKTDTPNPQEPIKEYCCAEIPLAELSKAGFAAGSDLSVKTQLIFDSGASGWDILTASTNWEGFAIQSQGADAVEAGSYSLPGNTPGVFKVSSAASGGAYYKPGDSDFGNSSGIFTVASTAPYNAILKYQGAAATAFKGQLAIDITQQGSRKEGTQDYITVKELLGTTAEDKQTTMPTLIPQVDQYVATPTVDGANISFLLNGIEVPTVLTEAKYHIQLFRVGANKQLVQDDPSWNDWGGSGFAATNAVTNSFLFTGLAPNQTYAFRIYGTFSSVPGGSPSTGPGNPPAKTYYFYDVVNGAAGRVYYFTTVGSVAIGTDTKLTADFHATSYTSKYLRLKYSLSATQGFTLRYTFVDRSNGGAELKMNSPSSLYMANMVDDIPIGGQSGAEATNDYFIPGHTYGVTVEAVAGNGAVIGSQVFDDFTLRRLTDPTFIITASPFYDVTSSMSKIAVTVAINDPDWTIVDSSYRMCVLQQGVTSAATDWVHNGNSAQAVYSYIVSSANIQPGQTYRITAYAGLNKDNLFPSPVVAPPTAYPGNISSLEPWFQRAVNVTAVDANSVIAGDVKADIGQNGLVTLTFDNSVNLNSGTAPYLQYSITSITSGTVISTRTVGFNPTEQGVGAAAYKTFALAGTEISQAGKYFVEYRLLNQDYQVLPGRGCSGTVTAIR